jgi:hypothetical protein
MTFREHLSSKVASYLSQKTNNKVRKLCTVSTVMSKVYVGMWAAHLWNVKCDCENQQTVET